VSYFFLLFYGRLGRKGLLRREGGETERALWESQERRGGWVMSAWDENLLTDAFYIRFVRPTFAVVPRHVTKD
jgi:hypothetical protein